MNDNVGRLTPLLGAACACLLSGQALAQEIDALQRQFELIRPMLDDKDEVAVFDFITKFRAYETQIGRARGAVTFGMTGDTTPSQDQFKANAGIDLEVGTYPSQLRVATRADVRTSSDDLREDVSTFLVNFDHYFIPQTPREYASASNQDELKRRFLRPRPDCVEAAFGAALAEPTNLAAASEEEKRVLRQRHDIDNDGSWDCDRRLQLEGYGFLERFSDSFMSIDRRFEVGAGIKLEWHSAGLNDEGADTLRKLSELRASRDAAKKVFSNFDAESGAEDFEGAFPASVLENRGSFARNQYSVWETGIAFSLFRESERPGAIATTILDAAGDPVPDAEGNSTRSLTPPVSDADRLTIRPSFVWRPRKEFAFTAVYYYKAKLGGESKVNGVRDARRDVVLRADWRVGELTKDRGSPTIGFVIEQREDSVPPDLASFSSLLPSGGSFSVFAAEREHRQARLEVKVNF